MDYRFTAVARSLLYVLVLRSNHFEDLFSSRICASLLPQLMLATYHVLFERQLTGLIRHLSIVMPSSSTFLARSERTFRLSVMRTRDFLCTVLPALTAESRVQSHLVPGRQKNMFCGCWWFRNFWLVIELYSSSWFRRSGNWSNQYGKMCSLVIGSAALQRWRRGCYHHVGKRLKAESFTHVRRMGT